MLCTQDGRRPLHFAAQYGQQACVALLLARGADASALNDVRARTRAPVLAARSAPRASPQAEETPLDRARDEATRNVLLEALKQCCIALCSTN